LSFLRQFRRDRLERPFPVNRTRVCWPVLITFTRHVLMARWIATASLVPRQSQD
jgi:hypothetical protein